MTTSETLRALLTAMEAQRWDEARGYLTEDFVFGGAVPEEIGPDAWLGVHKALGAAMPDFSFNASGIQDTSDGAAGQVQISGTQTRDLALPVPGIPAIPPTGKRVSQPAERITVTARGAKIARITVSETPGGGLPGILSQLGVALPAHS
jgi:SnoaL-like protein